MSEANKTQVGGNHYKMAGGGEEHWDRMWRLFGHGYFVGCITKYVERYKLKNGLEDLRKARHFLDKLIELEEGARAPAPIKFVEPEGHGYVEQDGLNPMGTLVGQGSPWPYTQGPHDSPNNPLTLRGDTKFP